jgi:hypothetical protein
VDKKNPPRGGKLLRAQPWLNLVEAGKLILVRGLWNDDFLAELEVFPAGRHDDQCFATGTKILSDRGDVPIESLRPGDRVWTRKGLRRVLKLWRNGVRPVHRYQLGNGRTCVATPNHPVILDDGTIKSLDAISIPCKIEGWQKMLKLLCASIRCAVPLLRISASTWPLSDQKPRYGTPLPNGWNGIVWYVNSARHGSVAEIPRRVFVQNPVQRLTTISIDTPVYNLEVEGENEYFAEGLLVHNCDGVSIGYEMIGNEEKVFWD